MSPAVLTGLAATDCDVAVLSAAASCGERRKRGEDEQPHTTEPHVAKTQNR
jgi:hypothetical protein